MRASVKILTKICATVVAVLAPAVYRERQERQERQETLTQRLLRRAIKKP
jgi:hypothetical protein